MTVQAQNVAFPRLMGAPAYARPPRAVEPVERPFDPDALPLAVEQTPDERAVFGIGGFGSDSFAGGREASVAVMPWPPEAAARGGYLPPGMLAVDAAAATADAWDDAGGRDDRSPAPLHFTLRGLTDRLRPRR